jgi:predicted nucleic acid-binding protein
VNLDRFFLDTVYALALLNSRDQYHETAHALLPRVRRAQEVCTTEAVLTEVANALARMDRQRAVEFIRACYQAHNIRIEPSSSTLFTRALQLYEARGDKTWGLTDCISFTVMRDRHLTDALTADVHFVQAGFSILLVDARAG